MIDGAPFLHTSCLPTGFSDARYLPFVGQLAKAKTADTELPHVSVGTPADFAAVVGSYLKPLGALLLIN
jgi:hypothetical protein